MKKFTLVLALFFVGFLDAQEENYIIKNIEDNTKFQDFGVSYYADSTVVFASTRSQKSIRKNIWPGNSQPFLELFKGSYNSQGEIIDVEKFSKKLNSKYHDADVVFTKDFKTVYFTRNNYLNKKFKKDSVGWNLNQLYKAEIDDKGKWSNIQPMPFNNDNYQTGHPALNKEENILYFISDMPGTYGKTDIYMVDILADGAYGTPKNLGPNVNTSEKEMFPFIDENDILYFASDGFVNGKGGLDIYAIQIIDNNAVEMPKNLGSPINSSEDDFGLVYQKENRTGYFASNRPRGKGDDDIYFFEEQMPIEFPCTQLFSGVLNEKGTDLIIPGALVELYDNEGNMVESIVANEFGEFNFKVKCLSKYSIIGSKENFSKNKKELVTSNEYGFENTLLLELIPNEFVNVGKELLVNINPIYFDLDKSNIRRDAELELEKVFDVMNKYPELILELRSHTDSRGSDTYNLKLSERRANSSVEWLISKGITASRFTSKGYGETQLANKCTNGVKCSEEEHQLNRRTEFVIVNPEVIK